MTTSSERFFPHGVRCLCENGCIKKNYDKNRYKMGHDTPPYSGLVQYLTLKIGEQRRVFLPDMLQISSNFVAIRDYISNSKGELLRILLGFMRDILPGGNTKKSSKTFCKIGRIAESYLIGYLRYISYLPFQKGCSPFEFKGLNKLMWCLIR